MGFGKTIILILILYFVALLQSSFLVHFQIKGITLNLALILVILFSLFDKEKKLLSSVLVTAICGGFFLDIYSHWLIGLNILIMAGTVSLIKIVVKQYVRVPFG